MSRTTTESARVVNVAAGIENTDRAAPVRVDGRDAAQGRLNRQRSSGTCQPGRLSRSRLGACLVLVSTITPRRSSSGGGVS